MKPMKNILCYGDSNTWGFNPASVEDMKNGRFSRDKRWTGVLQKRLGQEYYIIEEGLNGRTTVFDDPAAPGRNGLKFLETCITTHQPLDLIVIMLGTNDTKATYSVPVKEIVNGMEALIKISKNPYAVSFGDPPEVLIVSPVFVGERVEESWLWEIFDHTSVEKSKRLAAEYKRLAALYGCYFLDASDVARTAPSECIHIDEAGHAALASALAGKIKEIGVILKTGVWRNLAKRRILLG